MAPKPKPSTFMPKPKRKPTAVQLGSEATKSTANSTRPAFDGNFDDRPDAPVRERQDWEAPPLLYEGNYDEWIDKTSTMLIAVGCESLSPTTTTPSFSAKGIWLIKRYVRPELLDRVPEDCKNDMNRLMVELKKAAKPFRLMDLPSELRTSIYRVALRRESPVTLLATPRPESKTGTKRLEMPPPLTKVSRIVREETMPLYFQLNVFRMALNHLPLDGSFDSMKQDIEVIKWAKAHKIWLKHLRKLNVSLKPVKFPHTDKKIPLTIGAIYTPKVGLQVHWPDALPSEGCLAQERQVESYRRFLDLEGEALAMLWTADVKVWEGFRKATTEG